MRCITQRVQWEEVQDHAVDLINAAMNGETVLIVRDDQHGVQLVPKIVEKKRPQFGSAKGQIWMSDDWDEPLEDFKEYME